MAPPGDPQLPQHTHADRGYAPATGIHPARVSPSKRPREDTISGSARARLAPARRKCPPLAPTNAWLFKEPNPLYTRHIIDDPDFFSQMTIKCAQPGCKYNKVIKRVLHGTNNHKIHYQKAHAQLGLTLSAKDDAQRTADEVEASGPPPPFFAPVTKAVDHNVRYRRLVMMLIIKNNLSFSIVDQPEFNDLIAYLSPRIANLSRRVLISDL